VQLARAAGLVQVVQMLQVVAARDRWEAT